MPQPSSTSMHMMTTTNKQTIKALLLCLVSLALVSVTHACDHHHHNHHHHDSLQKNQDHQGQRRLRKGGNDKHHHHHDDHDAAAAADCDEDQTNTATTQGTTQVDRELFSTSNFVSIDDVEWASPEAFVEGGGRCHTREPAPEEVTESNAIVTSFRKRYGSAKSGGGSRRRLKTIVVPLYFHVLVGNNNKGRLTSRQIQDQIDVLEDAFAPDFTFDLKAITETVNDQWFLSPVGSASERAFKAALRQGGSDALNFYTLAPSDGVLGWATLPSSYSRGQNADGVCVNYASLPGGTIGKYNEGDTGVHESGHWFGLFHTFQGGCSADNDFISDTPAEEKPAFGCPTGRDTCGGSGADPIYNFMNYSDDDCMNEFTPDQYERMVAMFLEFRAPNGAVEYLEDQRTVPAPTRAPVPAPTRAPVPAPTRAPVPAPTRAPVQAPVPAPTRAPVPEPTKAPVPEPTKAPQFQFGSFGMQGFPTNNSPFDFSSFFNPSNAKNVNLSSNSNTGGGGGLGGYLNILFAPGQSTVTVPTTPMFSLSGLKTESDESSTSCGLESGSVCRNNSECCSLNCKNKKCKA